MVCLSLISRMICILECSAYSALYFQRLSSACISMSLNSQLVLLVYFSLMFIWICYNLDLTSLSCLSFWSISDWRVHNCLSKRSYLSSKSSALLSLILSLLSSSCMSLLSFSSLDIFREQKSRSYFEGESWLIRFLISLSRALCRCYVIVYT